MSAKKIEEENLDEIMKYIVKDIKKGNKLSKEEIDKLMAEANENVEFVKVIEDIKLASPDNRVIFVDGNEQLLYDHGEFFICDTVDSRKPKKKIKRKEATEKYIEYFIRYQLNPIIEQKQIDNISKTIRKSEVVKTEKTVKKDVPAKTTEAKSKVEVKEKEPVKKVKEDLSR